MYRNQFQTVLCCFRELLHPFEVTDLTIQRFMLPVYGALHLIPTLVLRRQHFARSPLKMLARVALGVTRSCSFLGIYVVIYQGGSLSRFPGRSRADGLSTVLPSYTQSGTVDQEWILERHHEA